MNNYIVVLVGERDEAQGIDSVAVVENIITPHRPEETTSHWKKWVAVGCVSLLLVGTVAAGISFALLRSGGDGDEEPAIPIVSPTVAPSSD
jgi:hypothetical protein